MMRRTARLNAGRGMPKTNKRIEIMTCNRMEGGIICTSDTWGRLHVGNRYIWMDFHRYCGPSFFYDSDMTKIYEPVDEKDPVWPVFEKWYAKNQPATL